MTTSWGLRVTETYCLKVLEARGCDQGVSRVVLPLKTPGDNFPLVWLFLGAVGALCGHISLGSPSLSTQSCVYVFSSSVSYKDAWN